MLAPSHGGLAPPPTRNPGSAPVTSGVIKPKVSQKSTNENTGILKYCEMSPDIHLQVNAVYNSSAEKTQLILSQSAIITHRLAFELKNNVRLSNFGAKSYLGPNLLIFLVYLESRCFVMFVHFYHIKDKTYCNCQ